MAKTKKQQKAKEPVRLRFKELANGNKSIYLDVYHDGRRVYEFLKLYLIKEASVWDKQQNAETLKAANAIKAQRVIELANGAAGLKDTSKSKMLLIDWLTEYEGGCGNLSRSKQLYAKRLVYFVKAWGGENLKLKDVTPNVCRAFFDFIENGYKKENGCGLSTNGAVNYINNFVISLNAAVKRGLIPSNPAANVEKPKPQQSKREFLTAEEVQRLIDTPTKYKNIKEAFLFSCFCGLRYSDVVKLSWGNIVKTRQVTAANIVQEKTRQQLYLPLSDMALCFMPQRNNAADDERVFDLPSIGYIDRQLKVWADLAGVRKHVTFHVARHTFATLMLTLGADLYTTSKLLGHTNVSTTQIYAKIVDQKKVDAVNLTNNIFK